MCFIYKSLVLLHYFKVIKEFIFLSYLCRPIDNLTWQARVGIFNSSKPFFKTKIKNRGMLQFLLYHTVYSLYLFLTFILITQANNLYQVSSRLIKNIWASCHLRFLKIADTTVFLLFFMQNSRSYCVFVVFHSKLQLLLCFCCFSFKIADVTVFLLFFIQNSRYYCVFVVFHSK